MYVDIQGYATIPVCTGSVRVRSNTDMLSEVVASTLTCAIYSIDSIGPNIKTE